jgi:uncharacterized protein YjbJ (UPF0337 family)
MTTCGDQRRDEPLASVVNSLVPSTLVKEKAMNWDQVKGNWKQLTGQVKEKWGTLTDDDLTTAAGQRDQMLGVLQRRYGIAKEKAEKELDEFVRSM